MDKTILIIDDEEVIRQSFSNYLEDMDFRTLTAENGRIGVEMFAQEKVDLVLVDLRMPEMNGIEVLAHIKEKSPDTPLIVVSGAGVITDAVEALHQGAWDYLLKPVKDLSELAHAVDMALEKAQLKVENRRYQQHLEKMVTDRTKELEKVNKHLRESEKRYRSVVELSPLGVGIVNTEGVIVDANQALASMLGYKIEEILGLTFRDITHPDDLKREIVLIQSLINNEQTSFCLEKRYRHRNGNYFWINITVAKMLDLAGDQVFIFGFIEDISHRKQIEREREQLINELQKALAEIKELRGFFPICSNCKKIRDDAGYWQQVEEYLMDRTDAQFTHSICPDCLKKLYPGVEIEVE